MNGQLIFRYTIDGDDFTRAGEASSSVKNKLKMLGLSADVTRRVAIAMYEGEINMVIHADGGEISGDPGCRKSHAGRIFYRP